MIGQQNVSIRVRKAQPVDAEQLIELSILFDGSSNVTHDVSHVQRSIMDNPTETVYVAEEGDRLLGYVTLQLTDSFCYERKTAELTSIFVREPYRQKGVASLLIDDVIKDCEEMNVLELFLRVNRENPSAIAFYRKSGLAEVDHFEYRLKYYD